MYQTQMLAHIGKDAVISQAGENSVINFTACVTERWLNKDKVKVEKSIWFDCSLFRQSTAIAEYLKKGQMVWISGKVDINTWQAAGGEFKAGLTLRVDEIELIGGKKDK